MAKWAKQKNVKYETTFRSFLSTAKIYEKCNKK